MEKSCQTCGDKGFSGPLIYCIECWDTVEHIYCLGLSCDDITEDFSWTCNSCKSSDNLLPKILVYGNEPNEDAKYAGYGPFRISDLAHLDASAMQVVGPIWRGSFSTTDKSYGSIKLMEGFMPKTSYSNVAKIARAMKPSLKFHMKKRSTVWPKTFDDIGAADSSIEIYILPAISSGETDYNKLVEYMIAYDLAMTANMAGIKLTVYTSLELLTFEKHKIQGKYYLWGTLKENKSKHVRSKCFKSTAAKKRTIKGVKKVCCPGKPSTEAKLKTKRKKTMNLASILRRECVPPSRPGVKRARSKTGKKRNDLKENSEVQGFNLVEVQIVEDNSLNEHRAPPSHAGLTNRPPLDDERHTEHGSCTNPWIDIEKENAEASNFPSTTSTVPLELSNEESTRIKSDLAPILSNILANHGDIALGCMTEPIVALEEICKVVQELKVSGLRCHHVNRLKRVMQLAEVVGIDVKWLCQCCDDLEKLVSHLGPDPTLKSEQAQSKKNIECEEFLSSTRAKVVKLRAEIVSMEETLESLKRRNQMCSL